jgi:hypothetical protein
MEEKRGRNLVVFRLSTENNFQEVYVFEPRYSSFYPQFSSLLPLISSRISKN